MIKAPRILIIDDDETILELAQVLFSSITQQEVHTALGGRSGLAVFQDFAPDYFDIITLDLNMPDIDGIQLVRLLAEGNFAGAIAFMSAAEQGVLNAVEGLVKEFRLQNLGSINKPFKRDTLARVVEQYQQIQLKKSTSKPFVKATVTASDIQTALDNAQFSLVYQPKVSTTSKQLLAVETLCRWHHPEKGNITPDVFIPIAEEAGLINQLTKFVIRQSFAEFYRIHKLYNTLEMSVNVSMHDLNDLAFPEFVDSCAREARLPHQIITLEVTESQVSDDARAAVEVLSRIKLMGMKLSIDDFGTGYSSMDKLKKLPFSELKVDKAFVSQIHVNEQSQGIFESNIYLAKKLRLKSVAEGVEIDAEWDFVANSGCDMVQGFLIAKPMPINDLIEWTKQWQ